MPARDTPWRSIVVAAECLRTWAPLLGALIPARRSAAAYDLGHGGTGQRPDRSHHRGEHLGRSQWWPALAHVMQECVADLLRHWQLLLAPGFAAHGEQPLDPVNVGKPRSLSGLAILRKNMSPAAVSGFYVTPNRVLSKQISGCS
jgi:hypothetical protein